MSKFLDYVEHVQIIDEAISPENYRDNQIGKMNADGKAVLVKDFLDKAIYFFQSFPFKGEKESVGPRGDDPDHLIDWPSRTAITSGNYKDYFVKKGESLKPSSIVVKQEAEKLEYNAFPQDFVHETA